ncbi:MAG: hypothetical protein FWG94_07575 [Oscillospiraceae bacterium]|nr:hypothetical protein [Oscillospiraceae bacterium]
MKDTGSRTIPLEYAAVWQADRRMLPAYLRRGDNARRIQSYKRALQKALEARVTPLQREHLMLFYEKRMNKTQIGKIYGVGSSTVCKTLKSAEKNIKEYIDLYMQIYDMLEQEHLCEDNELC